MPTADPEVVLRQYLAAMIDDTLLEIAACVGGMRINAHWTTPQALQWIARLRKFFTPDLARRIEQEVLRPSHEELISEGKKELYVRHHFTGRTGTDWGSLGPVFTGTGFVGTGGGQHYAGVLQGSTEVEPTIQSLHGPAPFNLAWGIHDGIAAHRVMIVFAGRNVDARGQQIGVRRGLLRWVNAKGGWNIPEGLGVEETARAIRRAGHKPWLDLKTRRASHFAFGGGGGETTSIREHYERIVAGTYERIADKWSS